MMLISEVLCTVVLKIRIIACTDLDCMFFCDLTILRFVPSLNVYWAWMLCASIVVS